MKIFYTRLVAIILATVVTYLIIGVTNIFISHGGIPAFVDLFSPYLGSGSFFGLIFSIFLMVTSVLLSKLEKYVKFKYNLSIRLVVLTSLMLPMSFLSLLYFIETANCDGSWICVSFGAYFLGMLIPTIILFAIFYQIGIFLYKSDIKKILHFIAVELILLMCVGGYFTYYMFLASVRYSSFDAFQNSPTVNAVEASKLCNSFIISRDVTKVDQCWKNIIVKNPGIDVCALGNGDSKIWCTVEMEDAYKKSGCEANHEEDKRYYSGEYNTSAETARANSCWSGVAKKYPGVEVCNGLIGDVNALDPWSHNRCESFLGHANSAEQPSSGLKALPLNPGGLYDGFFK